MSNVESYPVAIVGGGPVGLTMSIMLSRLGVRHVVFERHPGTSIHPKAVGLNQRTSEIFRRIGIEDQVQQIAASPSLYERTAWYTSFAGPTDLHGRQIAVRDAWGGGRYADEYSQASPSRYTMLPQIRLEPVLRAAAEEAPLSSVRFGTAVTAIEGDPNGVTLTATDKEATYQVRADYLVGADGGRTVAQALGIGTTGPTNLIDMVSAHFSADLSPYIPDQGCLINWFVNPDFGGSIGSGYLYHLGPWDCEGKSKEWVFACAFAPDDPERFDDEGMTKRIHRSLGVPGLDIDLHSISHWYIQAVVADQFRQDRCFLVGDAAHRIPPWGALGLNTGIQDADNLAWKLASVLTSNCSDSILNTYEIERRPVALSVAQRSLDNFQSHGGVVDVALGISPAAPPVEGWNALRELFSETPAGESKRAAVDAAIKMLDEEFHAHGAECGFAYTAGALVPEHGMTASIPEDRLVYRPTTAPGHHLPHAWISDSESTISTIDLMRPGRFSLIVGDQVEAWRTALVAVNHPLALHIDIHAIGVSQTWFDTDGQWQKLRQVEECGAVLVRPDAIVAWRSLSLPDQPDLALTEALVAILDGAVATIDH